ILYRQVIDSGHADAAPRAMILLGCLEEDRGDLDAARILYRQAIDSRHADEAPGAMMLLDLLEETQQRNANRYSG
ncbi:hypothetical protein, partial [Actinocorallia aurantiaca]|uniref:hypothetical protein n=1 Tax=Actinocorallia aurantiaca TaxID=46204 RepID=UPI0031E2A309